LLILYSQDYVASLYWSTRHYSIRLLLPIVCMGLFIIHPVGAQAFAYSLYWLIPVVLFFVPQRFLFLQALGSTFIAHAVGSVIWLYTVPNDCCYVDGTLCRLCCLSVLPLRLYGCYVIMLYHLFLV